MSSSTLPHRPAKETTSQPTAASDPGSEPDDSLLVNEEDDEEGWQSVGEEEFSDEASTCPFCSKEFLSSKIVFAHCAASDDVDGHGFDIGKYAKEKALDFYGTIKLINYLRTHKTTDHLSSEKVFLDDDKYLQPVIEDDPLLYALGDLTSNEDDDTKDTEKVATAEDSAEKKVKRLEEQLDKMAAEFEEYKRMVRRNFEEILEDRMKGDDGSSSKADGKRKAGEGNEQASSKKNEEERDDDSHYFNSYAGNDIHETMLKDFVRTDAYRDFIYDNKHLFKDKVVLDVGCGTGVLSMFCAKAGAKKVIAVDNSAIINKARANIFENGLDNIITCCQGKIEEVTLPVKEVDIIISEWMGYCLLYEAMLDSVLYARDKYLKATGLMVPSYTTLLLSPLCSSELLNSNVNFWNDIYGFKMSAMKTGIYEDAMTNYMSPQDLASDKPAIFAVFDLHEVKVEDLSFRKPFEVEITKDLDEDSSGTVAPPEGKAEVEAEVGAVGEVHNITTTGLPSPSIHGFVLWFDTFFTTSRNIKLSHTDRAETWSQKAAGNGVGISFTTGPFKHHTHWKQGVLLVDQDEDQKWREKVTKAIAAKSRDGKQLNLTGLKKGDKVKGYITYRKREENSRELEIEVEWEEVRAGATEAAGDFVRGSNMRRQMWYMR